jgi:O-antigen/teichoic acid export membrane protein
LTISSEKSEAGRAAVRHLGGQTAVVMGGTAFTFLVGLPVQISLARSLGASGLGLAGITEAIVVMAAGLLSFGLAPLAVRYIPEYRIRGASRAIRQLVTMGLAVLALVGMCGAVLLPRLVEWASGAVSFLSADVQALLNVLALMMPVSMVSFFLAQSLRGFQEIRMVVLSTSILALTAKVLITLGLFSAYGASTWAYAWALVGGQVVAILPMCWKLWILLRTLPEEDIAAQIDRRDLALYAGTNYASGCLNALVVNMDRFVIGALLGPSAVGVVMVARQLQQFPTVFHQVVLTVIPPVFARLKVAGDMSGLAHQLHLANDWVVRMAAGLILLMLVFADQILLLYGPDFQAQGTVLLMVFILAVFVNLGGGAPGILLNMTGHHVALLRISLVSSAMLLAGYFILIPLFGVVGVGLTVLLSTSINKGLAIWLVQRRFSIFWYDPRFRSWVLPALATVAVLFALRPLIDASQGLGLLATQLVGAAIFAYAVFFSVNIATGLHEDDRELIQAIRGRLARLRKKGADPR